MIRFLLSFLARRYLWGLALALTPLMAWPDTTRHVLDGLRALVPASLPAQSVAAPADARIDVAFSPGRDGENLILRAIGSAQSSVRLAAYSFTDPDIVRALVAAKRRGVDVQLVVDEKHNLTEERGNARSALNTLVTAGAIVRTNGRYAILHDKFIVVDGRHVQTGSYNYSRSAADRNSENVLVMWNAPQVAATYLRHWQSRFDEARPYSVPY
jgi:phosphatidylserine/phosphatidylglycerophosphate/cardiolipin synthase-like enzyme